MRVFSIAVTKNEADVIAANLLEAQEWSEAIFVMDNGSTDGTWEIVQDLASRNSRIVAWKQWDTPFLNGLRGHVYQHFKHRAGEGDWWCMRLDSDEFYVEDPRSVLQRVPACHHVVCKDSIEYRLTKEDLAEHEFTGRFEEDRDKIRYYLPHTYVEVRFFRHRAGLAWDERLPFPTHMGIIARERVPARHYKFRSPQQMMRRVEARQQVIRDASEVHGSDHPGIPRWAHVPADAANDRGELHDRAELWYDDGSIPVPTLGPMNHARNRWYVRWVMHVMHGLGIWA